jgi:glycyl-tRNA synthetase beta chain
MPDLLLEVGLEEIPARMIAAAEDELRRRVTTLLLRERLVDPDLRLALEMGGASESYSTPRRLAVLIHEVRNSQPDAEEQLTGPSWKIAFKDDVPTPAAHAFAKKAGVDVSALQKLVTPKGEYVGATVHRPGRPAAEVLTELLPKELAALYWPKNMYWRAGKPERFVRPVKWLLALLDHAIVPIEFAGVSAANLTYGHRILNGNHAVTINHPADYLPALDGAHVLPDVDDRRQKIRKALDAVTRTVPGARWREDHALVDAVTHLTEWPSVILGSFDPEYLSLPEEVLVTVMRDHQKYFAVEDPSGKLAPHFLAVLNTQTDAAGEAIIRHGNERVLRARFNDARFFWDTDQKTPLADRVEMLKAVTFQKDLGSYHVKTEANLVVALTLADIVAGEGTSVDRAALQTAVRLAKTDLTTELVKEFTELQGIVGGLYARAQGLGEPVSQAIYWQYSPAATDDAIPPTVEGQLLGLADRIATITQMFSIGLEPSGSKDPFALRRAANAIVKILAESGLPLPLSALIEATSSSSRVERSEAEGSTPVIPSAVEGPASAVADFFRERLEFYLRDVRGFAYDVVNAVLAPGFDSIPDAIARAEALTAVRGSDDFTAVSAAFKRIKNILRQAAERKEAVHDHIHPNLLHDPAEQSLHQQSTTLAARVEALRAERKYSEALEAIATLRPSVDTFFDKVMVMAPEMDLRQNRLALIREVLAGFSSIADFSEIVTSS